MNEIFLAWSAVVGQDFIAGVFVITMVFSAFAAIFSRFLP
jgi:hypothetical protein